MSVSNHSKGFTIIESVIAMLLLGIMMAAGVGFYTLSTRHSHENIRQRLAVQLANSQMELVRAGADPVPLGVPVVLPPIDNIIFSVQTDLIPIPGESHQTALVTVTWLDPAPQQVVLTTFVAIL